MRCLKIQMQSNVHLHGTELNVEGIFQKVKDTVVLELKILSQHDFILAPLVMN